MNTGAAGRMSGTRMRAPKPPAAFLTAHTSAFTDKPGDVMNF